MVKIWDRVDKSGTCWLYTGAKSRGYGWVYNPGGTHLAHRLAYEQLHGPARGLDIDHLCFERSCINPAHLEAVTRGENTRRSNIHHARLRTSCRKGHPRNTENARPRRDGLGTTCRVCERLYLRAWRQARRDRQIPDGAGAPDLTKGEAGRN